MNEKFRVYARLRAIRQDAGSIALKQLDEAECEKWTFIEWELNKLECMLEKMDLSGGDDIE